MFKIVILTSLVMGIKPNLQKFYGTWIPVMIYPNVVYIPMCLKYNIYEDYDGQKNTPCTCDDNLNTTLVIMSLLENMNYDRDESDRRSLPLLEVADSSQIVPSLNISCTCREEKFRTRAIAKSINSDYFILYELRNVNYYTKAEQNTAYVMAKNIQLSTAIQRIVRNVDELKTRHGGVLCATEIAESRY